jgi:hypothetical protein
LAAASAAAAILLDASGAQQLESVLQLICRIYRVNMALIALFGDRRIFILKSIGGFQESNTLGGIMYTAAWGGISQPVAVMYDDLHCTATLPRQHQSVPRAAAS